MSQFRLFVQVPPTTLIMGCSSREEELCNLVGSSRRFFKVEYINLDRRETQQKMMRANSYSLYNASGHCIITALYSSCSPEINLY